TLLSGLRCEVAPMPTSGGASDQRSGMRPDALSSGSRLERRLLLPASSSSFIGREQEIETVGHLLTAARFLTLTGAGGVGKSRLAAQVAARHADASNYDVVWVELSAISDPALVVQAIATALGVREQPGESLLDTIERVLQARRVLLVLDNCEHLIGECAVVVARLQHTGYGLRLLVTSHLPLGIGGETIWRVPPLALPDLPARGMDLSSSLDALGRTESVALFVDRARMVRPTFVLTPSNAP